MKRLISFRVKGVSDWETEEVDADQPGLWIHDSDLEQASFKFFADGSIDARRGTGAKLEYKCTQDIHPEVPFKYEYHPLDGTLAVYYGRQLRATMDLWSGITPPGQLPDSIPGGLRMVVRMLLKELSTEQRRAAVMEFCPGCMKFQGDLPESKWCKCWQEAPVAAS